MADYILGTGCSIHYLDYQPVSTIPVVLLHGLGATSESWAFQIPALLGAGFRVIAPDIRGFGRSSYPGGEVSIQIFATDILELLESLSIYRAHVVGISLGGTIALQLALECPEIVERLVLINTFATLRPERPGVWLYYAARFLIIHTFGLEAQAHAVARRIFPREDQISLRKILIGQICQANLKVYRATMRALARFEVTTRLAEIQLPALVMTGANDTTVTPTNQRKLAQGIPHARQVFIEGGGHAVIVEQPELVNNYLIEFLRSGDFPKVQQAAS